MSLKIELLPTLSDTFNQFLPVLSNSQLVLNILSINTPNVNLMASELKPLNCLTTLTTIPEAISNEPSCSNLLDLSIMEHRRHHHHQGPSIAQSWRMYDEDNSKSTDALLEEREEEEENDEDNKLKYPNSNVSFTIVKENPFKANSNSNGSLSREARLSIDVTEKPPLVVTTRSRSGSKTISKIYEPLSSDSLTDSHGYMDDFDESCALITAESDRRKRMSLSNDLIPKRSSLGVNKVPQSHRFSAGDADKLEKGIKASLPSTRSLRES